MPTCKGKGTSHCPFVVSTEEIIKLPVELQNKGGNVEIAIDVVYINDQSFYTRLIEQLN